MCKQRDARESLCVKANMPKAYTYAYRVHMLQGRTTSPCQIAVMRAAAAVRKTAVSTPRPHSPVSPAEQSAPLRRRVKGDGVVRVDCT